MNTATHPVYVNPGPTGPVFGPERVGAGRVDAYAAVGNGVIAYDSAASDLVSVTFGVVDVGAEEVVLRRTVTVQNLDGEAPVTFATGFEATSTAGGATITTTPSTIATVSGEVFYYISQRTERKVAFLNPEVVDQRVLAIYFNPERRVERIANYGIQDGKVFDFISRTTATGGDELNFLKQIFSGLLGVKR